MVFNDYSNSETKKEIGIKKSQSIGWVGWVDVSILLIHRSSMHKQNPHIRTILSRIHWSFIAATIKYYISYANYIIVLIGFDAVD